VLWLCAIVTLRQLVPASLLAGRWIAVLVCYLDDSGKDPQNPVSLLAGYVARDATWDAFEGAAEPRFADYGVPVLHATDLKGTRGCFKGWSVLKKQAFVSRICQARDPDVMMGVAMGVAKAPYAIWRAARAPRRSHSPHAFSFDMIVDWILRDTRTGGAANTEGIAFVLECGHENNAEVEDAFNYTRERFGLQEVMHSISFVPKDKCRAIQLADLLAFYTRRDFVTMLKASQAGKDRWPTEAISRLLRQNCGHRDYLATDFSDEAGAALVRPSLFGSEG
jgi:hypothetical protein